MSRDNSIIGLRLGLRKWGEWGSEPLPLPLCRSRALYRRTVRRLYRSALADSSRHIDQLGDKTPFKARPQSREEEKWEWEQERNCSPLLPSFACLPGKAGVLQLRGRGSQSRWPPNETMHPDTSLSSRTSSTAPS